MNGERLQVAFEDQTRFHERVEDTYYTDQKDAGPFLVTSEDPSFLQASRYPRDAIKKARRVTGGLDTIVVVPMERVHKVTWMLDPELPNP